MFSATTCPFSVCDSLRLKEGNLDNGNGSSCNDNFRGKKKQGKNGASDCEGSRPNITYPNRMT